AWHFYYALIYAFKVLCGDFVLRCSLLSLALCLLVFQWLKASSNCVLCPFGSSSELLQQIRIVGLNS
ncbi:hypothetical protein, partial [Vibrio kanaloae]|uniref:hypothetical protein n=1 Tax=Vibrio kanaloae TaxID=170673 RepID=UPI0030B8A8F3